LFSRAESKDWWRLLHNSVDLGRSAQIAAKSGESRLPDGVLASMPHSVHNVSLGFLKKRAFSSDLRQH